MFCLACKHLFKLWIKLSVYTVCLFRPVRDMHICTSSWSFMSTNRILFWVNNHDTSVICVIHLQYIPVIMHIHYNDVIMGATASQITNLTIVYSTDYSDADQRKHQSSASLAFERGIHRGPVISPYKWPVTGKCFHLMTSSWLAFYRGAVLVLYFTHTLQDHFNCTGWEIIRLPGIAR